MITTSEDRNIVACATGNTEENFLQHINEGMYMMLKKTSEPPLDQTDWGNMTNVDMNTDTESVNAADNCCIHNQCCYGSKRC